LDSRFPTLAEVLSDSGYRTGGFVANNYWLRSAFGLDRGFEHYEDRPHLSAEAVFLSTWLSAVLQGPAMRLLGLPRRGVRITAAQVNRSALRWIDMEGDDRPFFAFLNLYDAHEPYLPPAGVGFRFAQGTPRYWWDYRRPVVHSPADLSELTDAYDSCIHYLDQQLGRLLEGLAERGLLDNTLVVVTSDHGETIGEHGSDLLGHENNMFYDVLQIPLVFHLPGTVRAGLRDDRALSLVDVPRTILDLVGLSELDRRLPGTSVAEGVRGNGESTELPRSPALSQANPASYHLPEYTTWPIAKGPLHSLVSEGLHYIVNAANDEQLFEPGADPWEGADLARTPRGLALLADMRAALTALGVNQ